MPAAKACDPCVPRRSLLLRALSACAVKVLSFPVYCSRLLKRLRGPAKKCARWCTASSNSRVPSIASGARPRRTEELEKLLRGTHGSQACAARCANGFTLAESNFSQCHHGHGVQACAQTCGQRRIANGKLRSGQQPPDAQIDADSRGGFWKYARDLARERVKLAGKVERNENEKCRAKSAVRRSYLVRGIFLIIGGRPVGR